MLNRAPSYPIRPLAHFLPHVPSPSPLQQWLHFALQTDVAVVSKSEYATSTYYKKCPNMRLSIGLTMRDSLWERYTLLLRRRESGALKACETHKKTFLLRFAICSHHRRNLHLKKHFYFPLNNRKFLHISKKSTYFFIEIHLFFFQLLTLWSSLYWMKRSYCMLLRNFLRNKFAKFWKFFLFFNIFS